MRRLILFSLLLSLTPLAYADAVLDAWKPLHDEWVTDPNPEEANPDEAGQQDALRYYREHPGIQGHQNKLYQIGYSYALQIGFTGNRAHNYAYAFYQALEALITNPPAK
jgi:hypothetical protein